VRRAEPGELTFPLAGLLADPPGSWRDYPIRDVELDLGEDLAAGSPLRGSLHVARTNRGVVVTARLATSIAESCARCLRPIAVPVEVVVEEEVLPSIDVASGLALDRSAEPEVVRLTDHHELELEPLAREAVQLAEPIAPLCRPDCPGLCSECGAELASGPHAHDEPPVDPRLEALLGFRVDGDA
jgi:uncharacterized protein